MNKKNDEIRRLHVMAKPIGAACNLDCKYCYYLSKQDLLKYNGEKKLTDILLETFIKQYISAHNSKEIIFTWQGGEPTLLGLDYFKKIVNLQNKYCPKGVTIHNDLQTNGLLLNAQWCSFLKDNNFFVGLSIDGPIYIHDHYRYTKSKKGSFNKVFEAAYNLRMYGVSFATLTCVNDFSANYPLEIYYFLRDVIQSPQIQFIPIIEHDTFKNESASQVKEKSKAANLTPWSISAKQWGEFLCTIFDEWYNKDIGKVNVIYFESMYQQWLGMISPLCTHAPLCGKGLAMEPNGDIYSCDHYVYPEYRLGNIADNYLGDMAFSKVQEEFGKSKSKTLTKQCKECDYLFACYGECPKNRISADIYGNKNHNILCDGWMRFYRHIDKPLSTLITKNGLKVINGNYK
jgi:uncharacterized protein